jgi:glyoxylase-like metal-dependent hydrolase (beta-lactamase superfamily II)
MRVRPLLAGEIRISEHFARCPDGPLGPWRGILRQALRRDLHWSPVPVFLVEHAREGPILIDTGYAADAASDPKRTLGPPAGVLFQHRPYDLDVLLERAGVRASDVGTVVMTHLHSDHVSGVERFAHAEIVADRREWEAGTRGGSGLSTGGYPTALIRAIPRRRVVDLDGPDSRPLGPFAQTLDLFGDGSITLLATPGHTPGHCSVLLRTGSGEEILIAADAADHAEQLRSPGPTVAMTDPSAFIASQVALGGYAALHAETLVIPGHDHRFWPTLRESYPG